MRRIRDGALAASGVLVLFAWASTALAGGTMKLVAAEFPVPEDTEPKALSGLAYQTRAWVSEVKSIRLHELPEENAKTVTWILATRSTQSRLQKIEVDIFLLDAEGERLTGTHQSLVLLAHSENAEQKVKMKLPEGVWARAETARLEVRFAAL